MDFYGMNAFGDIYIDYEKYVRKTELNGKKPVSLLKFALGNF